MARYTLAEAKEFYDIAKTAYKNALTNKSYDISNRSKENQKITELKKEMDTWADLVDKLSNGTSTGPKFKRVIPNV